MTPIYLIVRIQLPLLSFQYHVTNFTILSKTKCMSIYYHFRRGHESSGFRNLALNKNIC